MRPLVKLLVTLGIAAVGLVVCVVALAPAARALLAGGSAGGTSEVGALGELHETSNVYDVRGNLIATFHADQNRIPVTFSDVPRGVVAAIVDTEDAKFWVHHGVNVWATARALFSNASAGGVVQGGSTITQQLVKNTLLTDQRTVNRKIKEAVLAVRLEDELSKEQILERYLNAVYFGNGAYGIGAAAQTYFAEPVGQLTRIQGAFLAGLIRDPEGYNPIRFPAQATARRNVVLQRMATLGHLTRAEAAGAVDVPVPTTITASPAPKADGQDGYFIEEVKQRLLADPDLGSSAQARFNAVFNGGLKIYTTLDPRLEADAKQAVADHLPDQNGTWTSTLVSIDSKTGAVRALVGGPGFDRSQYRIATEGPGRQPGSSFKPIVLAAALKEGYSITAGVDGSTPCAFANPGSTPYLAHNDEGGASGYMNLTYAMAQSVNCAYIRLGLAVGLDKVVEMAKALGVTTRLSPLISMSIGSEEVRPIDMAGVYATFANDGVHHTPYLVDQVIDRSGKMIVRGGDKGTQVMSADKAHEELVALRAVVTGGTGTSAALADRSAYGKTGTAENFSNAWFDGVTPQLSTVVWMGSPILNLPMTNVCGKTATGNFVCPGQVFGASVPAPIWQEYTSLALAGQPALDFPAPNPLNMGDISSVRTVPADQGFGPGGPPGGSSETSGTTPSTRPGRSGGSGGSGSTGSGGTGSATTTSPGAGGPGGAPPTSAAGPGTGSPTSAPGPTGTSPAPAPSLPISSSPGSTTPVGAAGLRAAKVAAPGPSRRRVTPPTSGRASAASSGSLRAASGGPGG